MRIDLLLLDVDGVLVHYQRAQRVLHLAQALDVAPETVQAALYDSGLEAAHDNGTLDGPAYLAQLSKQLGRTVDVHTWTAARRAASHPQAAVLQRLQALQLPMAVLTNNGALMQQALPTLLPELFPALQDRVFCSADFGLRKPAPEVFLRTLDVLGVAPARTLFVDDLFANVRGARAAGLHAETVRDGRGLGKVLKRYAVS
ncbi:MULTISPECIES: HAD-IA family hydrolase [unclassified Stenotrophomonas]|uniref:HAD-IA family hydrolase n=1 Tax=unclassified Stenotrophomonas TaxID=196198 RepID=UPI0024490852|nr:MULTISPECIES: HAD-IA family hydrolase [unclassified Stenotrophomonas]MBN5159098.1 HAD-IA family hydrolase [Stenotrophomonas maltophilia]MDG9844564.1 HAD-IA family hydrolase [Stenotrophomonas sp. GD04054]MDH0016923.1 HAD-IA family hydrolase [Stenotrophomonas sp. GD04028]MDH0575475.1 HAD-IA family hydrolase [Stenotrophomonas sp. GD03997]MDH0860442.1 HAD-IA family hydrolase [Stenotrophomonas sp. GD03882]